VKPDVFLVVTHDTGRYFGAYGRGTETPNFDDLAKDSLIFKNYFAVGPFCSINRAVLQTGKYPHANGVMGLVNPHLIWTLNPGEKNWARHLHSAGYETYLFGFQHETKTPQEFYDHVVPFPGDHAQDVLPAVADFVKKKSRDSPVYASIGTFETHRPFYDAYYEVNPFWKKTPHDSVQVPPYLPDVDMVRYDLAGLWSSVNYFDHYLGELVKALDEFEREYLLVVTVDHGIPFPRAKSTLYDAGLETALLIKGDRVKEGVNEDLLSSVDLLPTLLDYLSLPIPQDLQGKSFLQSLTGKGKGDEYVIAQKNWHDDYDPIRAIRTKDHKLIWNLEERPLLSLPLDLLESETAQAMKDDFLRHRPTFELYDLRNDPYELHNLADTPAYQGLKEELFGKLLKAMKDLGDPFLDPLYGRKLMDAYPLGLYRRDLWKGDIKYTVRPLRRASL